MSNHRPSPLTAITVIVLSFIVLAPLTTESTEPPAQVLLGSLRNRYNGVDFDHQLHADYAACSECHHHTAGTPPTDPLCSGCHQAGEAGPAMACAACHPSQPYDAAAPERLSGENRYHIDIPGLQGAYHLNCLPCHDAVDAPTGCLDCHQH